MEALLTSRFHAATLSHSSSPRGTHVDLSLCRHRVRFLGNSPSRAPVIPPLRVSSESHPKDHVDWHWESDTVDVIGIGSRKDAVIDFCLESPFASSSHLRFWTICSRDSQKVQLLQRSHGKDMVLRNVELPLSVRPCPPAVILVASAGHGTEHITAIELLNAFRSEGGLAVSILLKPFSFEGKRRQLEVDYLANMLQECSQLRIVVETDSILEKEVETLEEALKSVNNAVLMAVNMVYVLTSERYLKFLDAPHEQVKELKFMEALELFGGHGETNVGFGAGYNFKSSFAQAIFHCPFINGGMKDFKGIVVLMLARACRTYEKELPYIIQTFRLITECTGEIIFSGVHEPDLEPNLIVTTILLVGCNEQKTSQRKSFLSGLALRFPFFFSFLGRDSSEQNGNLSTYSPTNSSISSNDGSKQSLNLVDGVFEDLDLYADKQETEACSKTSNNENKSSKVGFSWSSCQSFYHGCHQTDKEHVEQLRNGGAGPGFQVAQQWSEECSSLSIENSAVFTLPVGVKSSRQRTDINHIYDNASDPEILDDMSSETLSSPEFPPGDAPTNVGFEAVTDICNSAFSPIKGKNADLSRKQGLLSVRAASMLEAERETQKKWTPIMEMQYRGGIYWGRCQGGLPEGKGRLALIDGSSYDGMWHCGKRSGLGTFFYSNGDVFQGSWRDDCMHGKGWFYFHTGDRWFANFWKGKANGEGRFYSKSGSIFFGNFHNGWRHGKSLFIDASGSRWTEIWEEGVLVSHSELGSQLSD